MTKLKKCGVSSSHGYSKTQQRTKVDKGLIEVNQCKCPDLDISPASQKSFHTKSGELCIPAIFLNTRHNPCNLLLRQKPPGSLFGVGETDQHEIAKDSETTGDDAFHEENP